MREVIFGPFRLDPAGYSLTRLVPGEPTRIVSLRPKPFDVLCYLVEHAGRIVSQDELLSNLWPDTHVQPEVLKGHILAARTALEDRSAPARYIETVRGRGYRFIGAPGAANEPVLTETRAAGPELLVGRDAARAQLELALARARGGETQIVFVTGDAGIGKTALADALASAAEGDGATIVTGHCLPGSRGGDAYHPILELLTALSRGPQRDQLEALLAQVAPTWLVQLPGLMSANAASVRGDVIDATPHRMGRELCDLLYAMSRSRLLLITIEDLHWADQATLDVIQALASQRMQTKLIVVATLRNTVASDASPAAALAQKLSLYRLAREISLKPLGAEDVAAFLDGLGKSAPPTELVTHLHARSEGNPLFMRAMLDLLVQRSLVSWDQGGWHLHQGFQSLSLRAPQSLVQIIEAEIGDLPLDAQAVLEGGSISDGAFSPAIHHVATALDEEAFELVCEDLARRRQLIRRHDIFETPDGKCIQTYAFCHSLFQEVAYDRQGANRRAQRHAAVAARLATLFAADFAPIASNLARHSIEAALWPEAIAYLRAASKTAVLRFALREAATSLERAIALTAKLPARERAQSEMLLVEDLARIYLGALDRRAVGAYDRLVHLARDAGRVDVEARALFGLGYVVSWTDASQSLSILSEAVEKSAQVDDPVQRARVRCSAHGWRSWIQGWNGTDADGLRAALGELEQLGDPLALAASLVDHSLVLFPAARYLEGIDVVARGFDTLVKHGLDADVDLSLPLWVTRLGTPWAQMSAGRLGEALDGFESGYRAFEANGDVVRGSTLRLYLAFVHERMHNHGAALDILDGLVTDLCRSPISLCHLGFECERADAAQI